MTHRAIDLDGLSPAERRELLARLRREQDATDDGTAPLSFAQERLWLLGELDPDLPLYNVSRAWRLHGHLDGEALRRALEAVVARHEILRTTFARTEQGPVQRVATTVQVDLPVEDLTHLPPRVREQRAGERFRAEARRPFDLERGPLLRPRLLRLGAGDHVLLLVHYHGISDAWSLRLLLGELGAAYEALTAGRAWDPEPLPLQYRDHARAQREELRGERLAQLVEAWERALDGAPAVLDLPTDRPRPAEPSHRGGNVAFAWPRSVAERVRGLCRREGVTPFMILLAAFQAVLHRWSGQRDIVVGSPVAGRTDPDVERLIGFFVNTLALRARIGEHDTFRDLLQHVKAVCLDALTHQELPFERLVDELRVERNLSRNPLFQVMFILQNVDEGELAMADLRAVPLSADSGVAKFDLTLCVEDVEGSVSGWLEYSLDLFDAGTAEAMVEQLRVLLDGALDAPDTPVGDLPMLAEEERRRLLSDADRTAEGHPDSPRAYDLVAARVRRTPHAPAVDFEGEELTYAELDAWSATIADRLVAAGASGRPVALVQRVGPALVASLLGVARAGAHWLCLQPDDPLERQRHQLEEVAPVALIAEAAGAAALAAAWPGAAPATLDPVALRDAPAQPSTSPEPVAAGPDDPVYVVYTSGSTGVPKGIVQSQRSFAQFVQWMGRQFALEGRRAAHWAAVNYDASYCEIFATLAAGGTLCMAPDRVRRDPDALLRWLRAAGVQWLQLVPSVAGQLLSGLDDAADLALEDLLLAGEPLSAGLAGDLLRRLGPRRRLYNLYGPTESVLATWHRVVQPGTGVVPVGRPIHGRHVMVLDGAGRLAPTGVVGEIHIRSPFLALGYHRRPDETGAAFSTEGPEGLPGPVYRTGDLGRWRADGILEFRGRRDQQVKIRGVRVELAEVEAVVAGHAGVADAAVVAREVGEGDMQLVAYVTPSGEGAGERGLRDHVRRWLPEALVPAHVVELERLPRTSSGKVDRLRLPEPAGVGLAEAGDDAPRTDIERSVAQLWCEVLGAERIGRDANFFAAGGNSLDATRLLNRVREELGADVPLRRFFAAPTVAALAGLVDDGPATEAGDEFAALMAEIGQLSDEDTRALIERHDGGERTG